jgi:hypothetical protein
VKEELLMECAKCKSLGFVIEKNQFCDCEKGVVEYQEFTYANYRFDEYLISNPKLKEVLQK